jgi:hypothetical protein
MEKPGILTQTNILQKKRIQTFPQFHKNNRHAENRFSFYIEHRKTTLKLLLFTNPFQHIKND